MHHHLMFQSSSYLSLMTLIKYSFIIFIQHIDKVFDVYFRYFIVNSKFNIVQIFFTIELIFHLTRSIAQAPGLV